MRAQFFKLLQHLAALILFSVDFEIKPKITSYRLPTHRHSGHRNFSMIPSYLNRFFLNIAENFYLISDYRIASNYFL